MIRNISSEQLTVYAKCIHYQVDYPLMRARTPQTNMHTHAHICTHTHIHTNTHTHTNTHMNTHTPHKGSMYAYTLHITIVTIIYAYCTNSIHFPIDLVCSSIALFHPNTVGVSSEEL